MKCQSDYGPEADAVLRQADVCYDEWWEDEYGEIMASSKMEWEEDDADLIVKDEMRKRGFVEVGEQAGV
jgi:hypothetical protein